MKRKEDIMDVLLVDDDLQRVPEMVGGSHPRTHSLPAAGAATAVLHGFGLDDEPLLTGLPGVIHEIVRARTASSLRLADIGSRVVVVFDGGDVRQPIILGVVKEKPNGESARTDLVSIEADQDVIVISADRQIVLRCGESSITLTRAGKVIIKGTHVVSRSSGYNRIKGAAVDIN